jgi:hypothetical protein
VPVAEKNRVVDLRADDAADRRGDDHRRGQLFVESMFAELAREHPSGGDEREEHHQAE